MRFVPLICLLTLMVAGSALAFAPAAITFQGHVTQNGGGNVPDGNHSLTFRIYNAPGGGSLLWSDNFNTNTQDGIFSVVLSPTLPFDQAYWLSVQYEAETPMTPRVPLTSAPYAMAVDEDAAVTSLNGNTGTVNLIAGANVSISPSGNNFIIAATGAVSDNDWNVTGNNMNSLPSGNVGIGVLAGSAASKLHVGGDITTGTAGSAGYLQTYDNSGAASYFGFDTVGEGAEVRLTQESGTVHHWLQPDFDGDGGYFEVRSGTGASAIQVNGHNGTTGEARITFAGNSSIVFDLEEVGTAAVVLPTASVSSAEIENEVGIASRNDHGTSSFTVTGGNTPVTSRTISVPTDGYLVCTASMELELNHQGTACFVTAGLSMAPNALPNNQDLSYYLPASAGQGLYLNPSTPSAVFPVSPGSNTVYIVASRSGTTDAVIWDAQLNVLFVPTAYGAVAAMEGADDVDQLDNNRISQAMTGSDIAAEQRESERANEDRMQGELDAMRAELDAIKQEMAANRNGDAGISTR